MFFQHPTEKTIKTVEPETVDKDDDKDDGKPLLCRFCRHKITSQQEAIQINGRHQHVFANPGGFVFEVGCFGMAQGCSNHGSPTYEFTWFSGYSWRFSLCARCQSHLGWHYRSTGASSFFGLITANLIEGKGSK